MAIFSEINPFGIGEMRFAREIWLRHVKCLRAWVDFILLDVPAPDFTIRAASLHRAKASTVYVGYARRRVPRATAA